MPFDLLFLITVKKFFNAFKRFFYGKYCPFCHKKVLFESLSSNKRKNVRCPICNSLERHRFLYNIYKKDFLNSTKKLSILHTAPERCIARAIIKNKNIEYYPIDICPEIYKWINCKKEDVTCLTYKDNSFDCIISNHVMEHIVDDNLFLKECLRVLKPNGILYLTFPISTSLEKTVEDKNIKTDEERLKYYGQADHVRRYGRDIIDKLKFQYNAKCIKPTEILSNKEIKEMGIIQEELLFTIKKVENI